MSRILVAVGGTGQEIALACLRLCHMAGVEPPNVVVIDSDQGTGRSGVPTRSDELQSIDALLKEICGRNFVTFLTPLAENVRQRHVETLSSLFSPAGVTPRLAHDVLSLLFTQEQQQTRLVDGFHGRPTVGAVAVEDYMLQGDFKDEFLDNVVDTLTKPQTAHFVVLAGSTSGGTGPGAVPPISQRLVDWRHRLDPPRTIEISGLVQLQWFHPLEDKSVSWSRPPDVDLVRLQRNSACLVRQYESALATLVDRLILVSLPEVVRRVSAGPNHQPETLHWLNILSGWIAGQLLEGGKVLNSLDRGHLYCYTLDEGASPLVSLFVEGNGRRVSLGRVLAATRVMAAFANALGNQLSGRRLDIALPKTTYRFLGEIRGAGPDGDDRVGTFLQTFDRLAQMDSRILGWFRGACASRSRTGDPNSPRDERDIREAFAMNSNTFAIDVALAGKLLRRARGLEQDFVADLLSAGKAHAEAEGPGPTAVALYRELRRALLDKLLNVP